MTITLQPESLVARIYGRTTIQEQYRCNFGVNPDYVDAHAPDYESLSKIFPRDRPACFLCHHSKNQRCSNRRQKHCRVLQSSPRKRQPKGAAGTRQPRTEGDKHSRVDVMEIPDFRLMALRPLRDMNDLVCRLLLEKKNLDSPTATCSRWCSSSGPD